MKNGHGHHKGVRSTGDPFLDLWTYVWADAFARADAGDEKSRIQLLSYFGFERLADLHRRNVIKWDPRTVSVFAVVSDVRARTTTS